MKHLSAAIILLATVSAAFSQITGGYSAVPVTDPSVVAAAKFAVDAKETEKKINIDLDAIVTAEQQVAAGMNFRLCLSLTMPPRDEGDDYKRTFKVIVYRDLKSKFSLTSWTEVDDCGTAAKPTPSPTPGKFTLSDDYDYFSKTAAPDPKAATISKEASDKAFNDFINSLPNDSLTEAKKDIQNGAPEKALEIVNKIIAAHPDNAEAYAQRSSAYYSLQKLPQSGSDAAKALKLDPKNAMGHFMTGLLADGKNDLPAAVSSFTRAIDLDPTIPRIYYDRGTIYARQENWQAAIADLTKAIAQDPTDADAHRNRAIAYGAVDKFDAKIEDLQVANEINPADSTAADMIIDNIRKLTPKQFETFANLRFDRLNDVSARLRPYEDRFGVLFTAKDGPGMCRQMTEMLPLRAERTNILSRVIILEIRTDLEHFKPTIEALKTRDAEIEAEEKTFTAVKEHYKCP